MVSDELPPVYVGDLDAQELVALADELGTTTEILEVRRKGGPTAMSEATTVGLVAEVQALLDGRCRALQVVWRGRGEVWIETLMATSTGYRRIRTRRG